MCVFRCSHKGRMIHIDVGAMNHGASAYRKNVAGYSFNAVIENFYFAHLIHAFKFVLNIYGVCSVENF